MKFSSVLNDSPNYIHLPCFSPKMSVKWEKSPISQILDNLNIQKINKY